jgi:hypothetical protein
MWTHPSVYILSAYAKVNRTVEMICNFAVTKSGHPSWGSWASTCTNTHIQKYPACDYNTHPANEYWFACRVLGVHIFQLNSFSFIGTDPTGHIYDGSFNHRFWNSCLFFIKLGIRDVAFKVIKSQHLQLNKICNKNSTGRWEHQPTTKPSGKHVHSNS